MGKAFSRDLRARVEAHIRSGHSRRDAARRFGVSPSFAVKLSKRVELTGSTAPARQGRPAGGGKLAVHMEMLIGWVGAQSDITMPRLATRLKEVTGVVTHPASLSRALMAAGFT